MLAKGRERGVKVALNTTVDVGMGVGIGELVGATVEGLLFELEGFAECSDAASFV